MFFDRLYVYISLPGGNQVNLTPVLPTFGLKRFVDYNWRFICLCQMFQSFSVRLRRKVRKNDVEYTNLSLDRHHGMIVAKSNMEMKRPEKLNGYWH